MVFLLHISQVNIAPSFEVPMEHWRSIGNIQRERRMIRSLIQAGLIAIGAFAVSPALAQDPTQSWWYMRSGWAEPAYRTIDRGTRVPSVVVPKQYRPHYNAFKYGWKGGNYVARRYRTGDRLYNYMQKNWQ